MCLQAPRTSIGHGLPKADGKGRAGGGYQVGPKGKELAAVRGN